MSVTSRRSPSGGHSVSGVAFTAEQIGGRLNESARAAVAVPPSSSLAVTVIVAVETEAAYVCVVAHTPAATATTCAADPSPQLIEHDSTSFEPGSVTVAEKLTLLDEDPAAGLVIVTVGARRWRR